MKTSEYFNLREDEEQVRALCEPLRSAPVPVTDAETARAEREVLLPFLAERIQQIPLQRENAAWERRQGLRQGLWLAAAAAVLAAAGVTAWMHFVPGKDAAIASRARSGDAAAFTGEAAFTTPAGSSARVVTEGGVRIDVAPATRARVVSNPTKDSAGNTAKISLMDGSVTLDVPPQAPGSSVRVVTSDATVTVHGTHFTVTYDATSASPRTCVRVEHGKVSVDRRATDNAAATSELITDGQSSGCDEVTEATMADEPSTAKAEVTDRSGRGTVHGSTLARENALLQQALAAEQSGDLKRAEERLRTLLNKYPQSSLSKEASRALSRVEKERSER